MKKAVLKSSWRIARPLIVAYLLILLALMLSGRGLAPGPNLAEDDIRQFCLAAVIKDEASGAPLSLAEAERQAIERALGASGGNKTQAARLLGITPKTLNAKLALYQTK